ncbi:MAG TPA: HipA domain-containing protein [Tepidiformaceae bacterium]
MPDGLAVWLYRIRVATIEQRRGGDLRLTYTREALDRFPLGMPLLSLHLPLLETGYPNGATRAFLDGLLPEAESRATIAASFDLVAKDTFGLIRVLGRDCAGALMVVPDDGTTPDQPTTFRATPLSETELGDLIRGLPARPLAVGRDTRVRLSLAGVQDKLALTRMPDGRWGLPVDGAPSTHIVKPQHAVYPNTVENEAFCMRVAKHAGLPAAEVEVISVEGRNLLAVKRYDRVVAPADPDSPDALFKATTLNVLLGNADAHGKNFSLLYGEDGSLQLAPLYDLVSTLSYSERNPAYDALDDRLAMYVDTVQHLPRVTSPRLVAEAEGWGMPKARAAALIADLLDRLPTAIRTAADEIEGTPPKVRETLEKELGVIRDSLVR